MEPQFITDLNGKRISVIIPVALYEKMMEELEDLEDIQLYKQTKDDVSEPFEDYLKTRKSN